MNIKHLIFFSLILVSCYHTERKYYYDNSTIAKIKFYKKNKNFTFIDYDLPKPERDRVREYIDIEIEYTFKKSSFHKNRTIFVLASTSTMNFGELYKIVETKQIRIDSIATRSKEFILLKLDPVSKGEYIIKAKGCRFSKDISIKIE